MHLLPSLSAVAILTLMTSIGSAQSASNIATCADERVKTTLLAIEQLKAAEADCSRLLAEETTSPEDKEKAWFYRGLVRFLQVVQKGAASIDNTDGSVGYSAPSFSEMQPALADVEAAIASNGLMKGDGLSLRATIKHAMGGNVDARADIAEAMKTSPKAYTPFVQRALEHENNGNIDAALSNLNKALELESKAGTALYARSRLYKRLGQLTRARIDLIASAALGPPFRVPSLTAKSEIELRMGDLRSAYDDLVTAARETTSSQDANAATLGANLYTKAGDLALDKLKDTDTAEKLYKEAAQLTTPNWRAALGLARAEISRNARGKAVAIYKHILEETQSTPRLYERLLASFYLRQLTQPLLSPHSGPFRTGIESDGDPSKVSLDGLKRIAFIIGAADYVDLVSLPNPRRDAAVIANALADMGFGTVEIAENPKKDDLLRVPAYIAQHASEADIAVIFYAGHGVEMDGVNYLIPVDAKLESNRKLKSDALPLTVLTEAASKAKYGSLVIVDACRDDPFVEARAVAASRGSEMMTQPLKAPQQLHMGLGAIPTPPHNNVVLHSTQPGKTAEDGDGLDSPFVRALLETLATPGQKLEEMVHSTSSLVAERTQGRQLPVAYGTAPTVPLLP